MKPEKNILECVNYVSNVENVKKFFIMLGRFIKRLENFGSKTHSDAKNFID